MPFRAVMGNSVPRTRPDILVNTDHFSEKLTKVNWAVGERGRQLRRPLIVPNAFAALTLEKTNQLAFAAIEQGLSDTRKGTADGTAALRILRPLGR
jgi:hypothetical protein